MTGSTWIPEIQEEKRHCTVWLYQYSFHIRTSTGYSFDLPKQQKDLIITDNEQRIIYERQ